MFSWDFTVLLSEPVRPEVWTRSQEVQSSFGGLEWPPGLHLASPGYVQLY